MQVWYNSPSICCGPELNPGQAHLSESCQHPDLLLHWDYYSLLLKVTTGPNSFHYSCGPPSLHLCPLTVFFSTLFYIISNHICLSYPFRPRASAAVCQPHRHPSGSAASLRVHPAAQQPGERHRPGLPPQPRAGLLVWCDTGPHHEGKSQWVQCGGGGVHRTGEPRWVYHAHIQGTTPKGWVHIQGHLYNINC